MRLHTYTICLRFLKSQGVIGLAKDQLGFSFRCMIFSGYTANNSPKSGVIPCRLGVIVLLFSVARKQDRGGAKCESLARGGVQKEKKTK